jgi:hypothetical protein
VCVCVWVGGWVGLKLHCLLSVENGARTHW